MHTCTGGDGAVTLTWQHAWAGGDYVQAACSLVTRQDSLCITIVTLSSMPSLDGVGKSGSLYMCIHEANLVRMLLLVK
jgi:hypothetical protein